MSAIVTYANNSTLEQHFFLNPDEIIGASTNDLSYKLTIRDYLKDMSMQYFRFILQK